MGPSTRSDYTQRILRVLVHIQDNLDASLSLDELAKVARFSPFHFHRIFRGMVGESVKHHVRRLRMERAAQRLKGSVEPVTHIAFEAGYGAHEAFTRAFRQAYGCSPKEYRAAGDRPTRIDAPNQVHYVEAGDGPLGFEPRSLEDRAMNVEIKTLPDMRVAYVSHRGPYDEVGVAWEELMDFAGANLLIGPEHAHFGACWSDPDVTPPGQIRYDACMVLGEDDVDVPTGIEVGDIPGGRFAVTTHVGPYAHLSATYATLLGVWFASREHEIGPAPSLEFYLNDPDSTLPEDLVTDVHLRIQ